MFVSKSLKQVRINTTMADLSSTLCSENGHSPLTEEVSVLAGTGSFCSRTRRNYFDYIKFLQAHRAVLSWSRTVVYWHIPRMIVFNFGTRCGRLYSLLGVHCFLFILYYSILGWSFAWMKVTMRHKTTAFPQTWPYAKNQHVLLLCTLCFIRTSL